MVRARGKQGKIGVSPTMTEKEYRAALEALGYSQEGFARLVGADPRTGQKWALGETRIPGSAAVLLRLLLLRPELKALLGDVTPAATVRKRRSAHA